MILPDRNKSRQIPTGFFIVFFCFVLHFFSCKELVHFEGMGIWDRLF